LRVLLQNFAGVEVGRELLTEITETPDSAFRFPTANVSKLREQDSREVIGASPLEKSDVPGTQRLSEPLCRIPQAMEPGTARCVHTSGGRRRNAVLSVLADEYREIA
jgi:hypothetical protein